MLFFGTYLSGKYKKYYFPLFYLSKKKKKIETKENKTNRFYCLLEPEQTEYILNGIQPETSFLKKCVLGRKNCFISTNPAGLPGGPPTLSASIAFICWPTEDHQNEVFPSLHISKSAGKIAVKELVGRKWQTHTIGVPGWHSGTIADFQCSRPSPQP